MELLNTIITAIGAIRESPHSSTNEKLILLNEAAAAIQNILVGSINETYLRQIREIIRNNVTAALFFFFFFW